MEDTLSSLLSSWEGVQRTPRMEQDVVGYVALSSSYLALGLAAFVCVFCVCHKNLGLLCSCGQHVRLKGFQNVHTCFFALLTMDVVHVILTIVYLVYISRAMIPEAFLAVSFLSLSRHLMVFVHLITVLMSICYLCDASSEGRLHYMSPFMLGLSVAFGAAYYFFFSMLAILGALIFLLVWVIISKSRFSRASPWKMPILFVATISVLVAFLPSFVFLCLVFYQRVYVTFHFYFYFEAGTNIQLFLDALLCSLILKLPVEEEQRCQEPNHVSVVSLPEVDPPPPAYESLGFTYPQQTSNHYGGGPENWHSGGGK
ncbi:uncharacterized protein V6R79_016962 [Siganus canaliculatus]